jgi:peptidoglycan/LPS O-acetylase OafA/YrhL
MPHTGEVMARTYRGDYILRSDLDVLAEPDLSLRTSIRKRIVFLDGLRGLAIGLVVLFHAFARWGDLVPYHDAFSWIPLFKYGWLGVQLFFLISGFVILMTIETCGNFAEFILRRWLRLFPASLVISITLFITAGLLPERPGGAPVFMDIIPGLLFIQPDWLAFLHGRHQGAIEGAYWSLYVEVIFYVTFGSLYFLIGELRAIILMSCAFIISLYGKLAGVYSINMLSSAIAFNSIYFGWFMTGALIYRWTVVNRYYYLFSAVAIGAACPLSINGLSAKLAAALIVLLFLLVVFSRRAQEAVSYRLFLFLGFISYPLYLLHENMMVALIIKAGRIAPWMPNMLVPAIPIAMVVFFGWLAARFAEPATRLLLQLPYRLLCQVAGAHSARIPMAVARTESEYVQTNVRKNCSRRFDHGLLDECGTSKASDNTKSRRA